jgi:hypothetical protein
MGSGHDGLACNKHTHCYRHAHHTHKHKLAEDSEAADKHPAPYLFWGDVSRRWWQYGARSPGFLSALSLVSCRHPDFRTEKEMKCKAINAGREMKRGVRRAKTRRGGNWKMKRRETRRRGSPRDESYVEKGKKA